MGLASTSRPDDCQRRWQNRIRRSRELQNEDVAAVAPLRFYERILTFQRDLAGEFHASVDASLPIKEQIDLDLVCSRMPSLLRLAAEHGPDALAAHARRLEQSGEPSWRTVVQSALSANGGKAEILDVFLGRVCLQSIAEDLQLQIPEVANYSKNVCPACGDLPQLAVLRPEGEGASRWLMCSFCLREWLFRRVICPWCGEEDKEKLPRFTAERIAFLHVEACDTCKRYLKAVDMSVEGRAVPLVDEAALAVLDVWAVDRGYTKIVPN